MSRLSAANEVKAREIIGRYPRPKSALIPLCHLAQEQDGHLADDAMVHIAELIGVTPAEVLGTASFYEMFVREPIGRYRINICTNISCQLMGAEDLLAHAERTLGVTAGATTPDGLFTLGDVECIAACTEAPACQVNFRYLHQVSEDDFDALIEGLRSGRRDEFGDHGQLARTHQSIPADRSAGVLPPEGQGEPAWFTRRNAELAPQQDPS